jgi:hypothetical protein
MSSREIINLLVMSAVLSISRHPLLAYFPYFGDLRDNLVVCVSPSHFLNAASCPVYNFWPYRRENTASKSWTRRFLCGLCRIKWK